jgi:hypothetical protein
MPRKPQKMGLQTQKHPPPAPPLQPKAQGNRTFKHKHKHPPAHHPPPLPHPPPATCCACATAPAPAASSRHHRPHHTAHSTAVGVGGLMGLGLMTDGWWRGHPHFRISMIHGSAMSHELLLPAAAALRTAVLWALGRLWHWYWLRGRAAATTTSTPTAGAAAAAADQVRGHTPYRPKYGLLATSSASTTTSQLDRSDFQSIMGSYEGAFSAEPAAGDHPRGGW